MAKHLPSLRFSVPHSAAPAPNGGNAPRRPSRKDTGGKDARRAALARWRAWPGLRAAGPGGRRWALTVGTILVLSALLSLHLLPDKVSLRAGDISTQEVRAMRTVQYVDQERTRALSDAAAARVDPIYFPVRYASSEADQTITDVFERLRRARGPHAQSASRTAFTLRQEVGVSVSPVSLLAPLLRETTAAYQLDQAERLTRAVVHAAMSRELRADHPEDLTDAQSDAAASVRASSLPRDFVPAVSALACAILRPNRQLDERATEKARLAERQLVAPVIGQIFAGDIVARAGETVTPDTISKLRALGLQNPRLDLITVLCVTLLTAFAVGCIGLYLARYMRPVYQSTRTLTLLSTLVILSVLGLKLGGSLLGVRLSPPQFGYVGMLSVTGCAMLVAALIQPRLAMMVTALLAALSGLILGGDLRFAFMTLLSGFVGIYAVSDIRARGDVVRAGALLCASNVVLSLLVGRIEGDMADDLHQAVVWAFFSGLLSVALFSVGAALFERVFGITTHLGLLELSDPNNPLLTRFCQIAPGTFTHSVMVGNLAVVAAEAIGADALLCRVGAYYHDLGKMKRAEFFVENQGGGDNIHARLNPSLSALVVTAHVKDGLEIADQEHLPPVIKAFITEHHGTSLIRYFFHQQMVEDGGEAAPGLEQRFRYGGPKPQSRETAILMLADSVEAASRTLDKPTVGRINDLVDTIISALLADGQLDECDLTLRDLRGIRDAFTRLLAGMLHTRIEYPDLLKDTKADKNGTADPLAGVPALGLPEPALPAGCGDDADPAASSHAAA